LFDVFDDENKLGVGKKSCAVSFVFEDTGKTLQDKEIDAVMNQLTSVFEGKLGTVSENRKIMTVYLHIHHKSSIDRTWNQRVF
jgi:phenylalanyl-tRNA synthetase beta subunit